MHAQLNQYLPWAVYKDGFELLLWLLLSLLLLLLLFVRRLLLLFMSGELCAAF